MVSADGLAGAVSEGDRSLSLPLSLSLSLCDHRKPENVLFDMQGHMRLTDFGLAKRNISTSQRDTACGTPLYMPPEAIANMRDGGGECTRSHVDTTLGFAPCLVSEILCRAPVCLLRVWATARRVRPASRLVDARHAPLRDAVRKDTVRAPRHACLVVQDPGLSLCLCLAACPCPCPCL